MLSEVCVHVSVMQQLSTGSYKQVMSFQGSFKVRIRKKQWQKERKKERKKETSRNEEKAMKQPNEKLKKRETRES